MVVYSLGATCERHDAVNPEPISPTVLIRIKISKARVAGPYCTIDWKDGPRLPPIPSTESPPRE